MTPIVFMFSPLVKAVKAPIHGFVKASFYADKFEGRRMANGRRFHQDDMVAASLRYPVGTRIRVTSLKTGREVVLTVSDRGPWHTRFSLDLSKAAFRALGLHLHSGWGWVTVEKVNA
jgi:rare lipoprotein A